MKGPTLVRALWRTVLCAAAVAGGAAIAHATRVAPVRHAAVHAYAAPTMALAPPAPPAPTGPPVLTGAAGQPDDAADPLGERFRRGLLITGATSHRLILFTFDDGPDRRTTPELLDRLDAAGVHAVFFLSGSRLRGSNKQERDQQEIAREEVRRGHLVASHSVDHLPLYVLADGHLAEQVDGNAAIFEEVLGARPWLFRPPFGIHTPRVDKLLADRGYTTMLWNLGAGDWQVGTAEEVHDVWRKVFERREREEGHRGGIVLLHDTHEWSVMGFQLIYDDLMARNCALLEAGEELYDIVDDPTLFFAPRRGEDASAQAPWAEPPPAVIAARQSRLREETAMRCAAVASR